MNEQKHFKEVNLEDLLKWVTVEQNITEKQFDDTQEEIKELTEKLGDLKGNVVTLISVNNYLQNLKKHIEKLQNEK